MQEKTKSGRKKNIICPLCKKPLYGIQNLKVHLTYKHPNADINEILQRAKNNKNLRPYHDEKKEADQEKEQPKRQPNPKPKEQEPREPGLYDNEPREYPNEEPDDNEPY